MERSGFEAMLEFNTNTLAFMTAALEQACRQLKSDTPDARQFIANKLTLMARKTLEMEWTSEAAISPAPKRSDR
jgi:hypothetical protein